MAKEARIYRFDDFCLDFVNRQLRQGITPIGLSGRYFDALALLVKEHGQLVEKDVFFKEVWGDVVVGDAALSQCIKEVRKQLGDDAANPRYIETVPRYGYRFVGAVSLGEADSGPSATERSQGLLWLSDGRTLRRIYLQGSAGTIGGGLSGALGGMLYGFALASAQADTQLGTASILLVLVSLASVLGIIGGFGVSFGMAVAELSVRHRRRWRIAGAAFGGLLVGALANLLGMDAFTLLFGRAPVGITGGLEGAVLGAAVGLGAHMGGGLTAPRWSRPVVGAGLGGLLAGVLIPIAGGRLLGGSLLLLARSFASSRLQLDALGRFFGELQFGPTTQVLMGGVEGLLFGCGVLAAVVYARRVWFTTG